MARRKRLTFPADPAPQPLGPAVSAATRATGRPTGLGAPPIARIAAETAASAALDEMAEAWTRARDTGRMIQELPLAAIDEDWLIRDRLTLEGDAIKDLIESIRARGQQVPIEVAALTGGRYGLISGWRRLRALSALADEPGGEGFATVLAVLRRPAGPAEAYRAMVEENEIRANLSYYERARIALRATEASAFADSRAAVAELFAAGSRAKRSKIASFLTLVSALDERLRFAWTIPERLGLDLARALEADPALIGRLRERLRKAAPASARAELALLTRALERRTQDGAQDRARNRTPPRPAGSGPSARRQEIAPGLWLRSAGGPAKPRLVIEGAGVDEALRARLVGWLQDNAQPPDAQP